MERSPDFYEQAWGAAYAAAHVATPVELLAAQHANNTVRRLRELERIAAPQIVEREELFRAIRAESVK